MSKIINVNLGDINLPAFQAHRNINPDHLIEISESIKTYGVIEPLIIRNTDNGLEIVAGCVRYQGARIAGLKSVPCINMSLDPKAAEIIKLHENIKRIPLDHVDQGNTFIMMMDTFDMSEQSIADVVGKSVGYVSQHVCLVRSDDDLTKAVKTGNITFSQSRELMRIKDKSERTRLLGLCIDSGASVSVLKRWVEDHLRESAPEPVSESTTTQDPILHNDPHISRFCEACNISVPIALIRQVFFCPTCRDAILNAISDEKFKSDKNSSKNSP